MITNWSPARVPEKEEIRERLAAAKAQLYEFQMKIKEHKIPVLVLFEGWGASGKGSTIGKVIKNIDPRFFKVATMSAPTEEEISVFVQVFQTNPGSWKIYFPGFRMDGTDLSGMSGRKAGGRRLCSTDTEHSAF